MKPYLLAATMAFAFAGPLSAAETTTAAEAKAEYVKKIRVELDELSAKIDALELEAKKAGASAKKGLEQKLKALKARRRAAQRDFAKLKRASGKAWSELKTGLDRGIEELKTAYDEAAAD